MPQFLSSKPVLPPGYIDLSVGEPVIVRETLANYFDLDKIQIPNSKSSWEYPNPIGFKALVSFLEAKHGGRVIITNGAKQALGATFYALKKDGHKKLGMRLPYWALIPPLVKAHGLECVANDHLIDSEEIADYDSYLWLAPNNPDGDCPSYDRMQQAFDALSADHIPLIHDAAYYTHTYLPREYELGPLGDMQIFSISKMLGLSSLRLGYIVCYNDNYYQSLCEYVEMMTVGVSTLSQEFLLALMMKMENNPSLTEDFEVQSALELFKAKKLFKNVNPEIIELPEELEKIPGMFAWVKLKNKEALTAAKVNVIDGALFGMPGYVRINLAVNYSVLEECIDRLNKINL